MAREWWHEDRKPGLRIPSPTLATWSYVPLYLLLCSEKEILSPRSQDIAFLGALGTNGHCISLCGTGVLCGPAWHGSGGSSVLRLMRLPPASCLVSGMEFPQQRASGGKVVPSCQLRLGKIALEPAPASLGPSSEHIQLPRKREGERDTEKKKKGNFHFFPWLGSPWPEAATHLVGGRD